MRTMAIRVSLLLLILGLGPTAGRAQQQSGQQQQPPATQNPADTRVAPPAAPSSPLSTRTAQGQTAATAGSTPASPAGQGGAPLTGAETYTLGSMGRGHNYFYPLFQVAESGDTNSNNRIGSKNFESATTVSGSFTLDHVWSRYNFSAQYQGSGFFYNQNTSRHSSAHVFTLSQTIRGVRSSFVVTDSVSYLPEAAFGYARFGSFGAFAAGGLNAINSSNLNLNGAYLPSQSILTGSSTRISNAAVAEYDYRLSPLSSLTFTGAYSLLRFPNAGFIDSDAGIFGLGYNHSITPRDTLGITYRGTVYRYNQSGNDFSNHIVALMYGHRISRVFSLSLGGGPQVNLLYNAANNKTLVSWYATASLDYQLQRTRFTLYYTHYTSAGAGVFLGSDTDDLGLSIDRRLTRMWSADMDLGYSRNKNLRATAASPTFNTWYATANLQRSLGQYMNVFLSYNVQQQYSSNAYCIGSGCGTLYTQTYFSLGFSWHPRATELGAMN